MDTKDKKNAIMDTSSPNYFHFSENITSDDSFKIKISHYFLCPVYNISMMIILVS